MEMSVSIRHTVDSKISGLRSTFQDGVHKLEDIVLLIGQVISESESCKTKLDTQLKLCESGTCKNSESLKKIIASKDNMIQLVACSLLKLNINNNQDSAQVRKILQLICGETNILTPPKTSPDKKSREKEKEIPKEAISPHRKETDSCREETCSPSYTDVLLNDESVSEIEGTPTGRTSPIIHTKKVRNGKHSGEKKKCPDNWSTPEKKNLKLCIPTPTRNRSTRMKQSRLNLVKVKPMSVVDLTCSPEVVAATNDSSCDIKLNIKREPIDNDETIMPSPTSGPYNLPLICKSTTKESPCKFKKPLSLLKIKRENEPANIKPEFKLEADQQLDNDITQMENSINLLNPNRYNNSMKLLIKEEHDTSVSLLNNVKDNRNSANSPVKRPLAENINVTNVQHESELESSISLLRSEHIHNVNEESNAKRKTPEKIEAVYKEPTVRNQTEKRALPGWSCEECKNFYAELHKDNYEMLKKKMEECSRHRGRNNPVRPKTPPGFWEPRWTVPDDTEEFNRRNNAI